MCLRVPKSGPRGFVFFSECVLDTEERSHLSGTHRGLRKAEKSHSLTSQALASNKRRLFKKMKAETQKAEQYKQEVVIRRQH